MSRCKNSRSRCAGACVEASRVRAGGVGACAEAVV
jgi:hypothetical protein